MSQSSGFYRYYKKIWSAFSSPILNAQNYTNYVTGTNIGNVYQLFDGNRGTYVYLGSSSYYVNFTFPNEVDLTNFVLSAQRYNPVWPPSAVKFYAKLNGNWSYLGGFSMGSIAWEGGINMGYSLGNRIASREIRIELGGGTLVAGDGQLYSAYALELSFTGRQMTSIVEISEAEYEANKTNSDYYKVLIPNNLHTIQTPKYLSRIERLYPNTTQVGTSVNISNTTGIARGFTTDSYLKYNIPAETFTPADGSDFEVQLAFRLPEGATGGQLIGSSVNRYHWDKYGNRAFWQYAGIQPIVSRDKIVVNLLNEHTYGWYDFTRTDVFYTANIAYNFDTTTTYVVNIKKVGTKYTTVLTDVNNTFTRTYSAENVNVVNNRNDLIGANLYIEGGSSSVFNGQIDLKNSFIKKKGNYFWTNLEVFEAGMMPQIHNIATYKYLNATEREEDIADYVKNSQPSIGISGLTNLTEEQSKTIINSGRVTNLTSTGSYTSVYTFSDDIAINSLEFCTGYNGDGYGYLSRVTVEVYKDGKWNTVYDNTAEQGGWNETVGAYGKYISTPFTALINNTTYSNMYRVTLHGMNQVLGGISYYGWINNFKLNVSKKNIISAGRVPQYYNIIRNELEQ